MNTKKRFTKAMMFVLVFTIIASSTFTAFGAAGKWIKSGNRWWYRHNDSSYTTNDWEKINNKWYHFDGKGWMQTGWLKVSGKWYYLNPNGAMATGWKNVRDKWYYLNSNGAMATGWKKVKGEWYYLNSNGAMASDDIIHWKGNSYYVKSNGAMVTGWYKIYNEWSYYNLSGERVYSVWVDGYYLDCYGVWRENLEINIDSNVKYLEMWNYQSDNSVFASTTDTEIINEMISYTKQIEVTKEHTPQFNGPYDYNIVLNCQDGTDVRLSVFGDKLFCNGIIYDVDIQTIENIWNLCQEKA